MNYTYHIWKITCVQQYGWRSSYYWIYQTKFSCYWNCWIMLLFPINKKLSIYKNYNIPLHLYIVFLSKYLCRTNNTYISHKQLKSKVGETSLNSWFHIFEHSPKFIFSYHFFPFFFSFQFWDLHIFENLHFSARWGRIRKKNSKKMYRNYEKIEI